MHEPSFAPSAGAMLLLLDCRPPSRLGFGSGVSLSSAVASTPESRLYPQLPPQRCRCCHATRPCGFSPTAVLQVVAALPLLAALASSVRHAAPSEVPGTLKVVQCFPSILLPTSVHFPQVLPIGNFPNPPPNALHFFCILTLIPVPDDYSYCFLTDGSLPCGS